MSFSSDIKQELNKTTNLSNKELVKHELIGYLMSANINIIGNKEMRFSTESDYNINRFSKLLVNLDIDHKIDISGKIFHITLKATKLQKYINDIVEIEENMKAVIRGVFMGGGSVNNPANKYHLEISLVNEEKLYIVEEILQKFNLSVKRLITQNKYTIYIKEGEEISRFLALLGANKAVLLFEDIRIRREMNGKVNRLVNCESANLNKTMNASIEQISAIKKLQNKEKFSRLDDNLKEMANLRLENPNMSLIDLGKLLEKPVGKSGVNYRLKKIMELADEI